MSSSRQSDMFSTVGIDAMGFYTPTYYVDLRELAQKRGIDPKKYEVGLLVKEMRIPDIGEDIVTMSVKAAQNALLRSNIDPKEIDAVFVGTETVTYAVKSVSNIIVEILGISPNSITQDIYNACAGASLAILNALSMIENGIVNKALIIGADISSYDLNSPGEPTQGAGAIAFILSKNPRIARFSRQFGKKSGNVNDFFRNAGAKNATVFGKYSVESYLNFQLGAFDDLKRQYGNFNADYYVFHAPFSKLPIKFLQKLIVERSEHFIEYALNWNKEVPRSRLTERIPSIRYSLKHFPSLLTSTLLKHGYSRQMISTLLSKANDLKNFFFPHLEVPMHFGNMYSAAIWAELMYTLENYAEPFETIYFGSYGSGAVALSGILKVQPEFQTVLNNSLRMESFLHDKEQKSVEEYERLRLISNGMKLQWIKIAGQNKLKIKLNYCDEGCNISQYPNLDYCPKGHTGSNKISFPIFGEVIKSKQYDQNDLSPLFNGYVLALDSVKLGDTVEFEFRRWRNTHESNPKHGLLNWAPIYRSAPKCPYISFVGETQTNPVEEEVFASSSSEYSF